VIDLHLHTTASDGRYSPAQLVDRVRTAGLTVMSVTDHDTVAGLAEARGCAEAAGITFVDGIEITSVNAERDVHMLGYFIDPHDPQLAQFLETQRASRVARVREIGERLHRLGLGVDVDAILAAASAKPGVSVGRPLIARALVAAGHVYSISDAFERYLGTGQPAFVPRIGQSPSDVVAVIHRAGGLASLAHPGVTRQPALIEPLVSAGLDAIEVFHSDHPPALQQDLLVLAQRLDLLVTGGSDYHGEGDRGRVLGGSTLPRAAFERLVSAVDARRRAS
jgi:predicted metal-dependent phosphoesterase TrpH